jgi:hypothetical protein
METSKDTPIDFIKWLEERRIYLIDISGRNDRFVTGCRESNFSELKSLFTEYQKDGIYDR